MKYLKSIFIDTRINLLELICIYVIIYAVDAIF